MDLQYKETEWKKIEDDHWCLKQHVCFKCIYPYYISNLLKNSFFCFTEAIECNYYIFNDRSFQIYSSMPNCSHPTAYPRQPRGAVWSSVPQGKRRITAQMATTINKYIRKRYKEKLLSVKENSLLCETCFAKEQRRMFRNKSSTVSSSDEELSQSIPSASLLSEPLSKKTLQTLSKPFNAPIEASSSLLLSHSFGASSSLFVHSTPIISAKEPAFDFV